VKIGEKLREESREKFNKACFPSSNMKSIICKLLSNKLKIDENRINNLIEIPPKEELGDYAFPCFSLAKEQKKSPLIIAQDLCEDFRKKLPEEITNVTNTGAYLNFFINKKIIAQKMLEETKKTSWGKHNVDSKKIGIEYPAPNTNKPLHVGHLRNISIGNCVMNILKNSGNKVYHLNLFNDRGILISKSMLAYQKFGNGSTPEKENMSGDKFVGKYYVMFGKEIEKHPEMEEEAKELLQKWESGDKDTIKLWKQMNEWAYDGLEKTFDKFGLYKIDKNYYESELYKKGKEIIEDGLKKKIFTKKDNAIIINLEKEKLGEKVLLRSDGTSVYITQDLYLAMKKIEDFDLDSSYYVVGNDQIYHFQVLFSILNKLGIKKDWKHFSYGMVMLPTGKMKSRDGTAKSAEDLIEETKKIAMKNIFERSEDIDKKESERRGLIISLAAIKYFLLKVDINKNIIFNPQEALSFEGNTGPYLLYSYARANSIIKKAKVNNELKIVDINPQEASLIKKINSFPEITEKAYEQLSPTVLANYAYELSQIFNEFYHMCPVVNSSQDKFRLELVESFKITLRKTLDLLGIDVLDEM